METASSQEKIPSLMRQHMISMEMRALLPMEMEMSQPKSMQTAVIRHLIMTGRTA